MYRMPPVHLQMKLAEPARTGQPCLLRRILLHRLNRRQVLRQNNPPLKLFPPGIAAARQINRPAGSPEALPVRFTLFSRGAKRRRSLHFLRPRKDHTTIPDRIHILRSQSKMMRLPLGNLGPFIKRHITGIDQRVQVVLYPNRIPSLFLQSCFMFVWLGPVGRVIAPGRGRIGKRNLHPQPPFGNKVGLNFKSNIIHIRMTYGLNKDFFAFHLKGTGQHPGP